MSVTRDTAYRSVAVGATALIALLAVEYVAVGTAMPTVARDLDGLGLYSLVFGATVAASVVGLVMGGWWCDRAGPRPVVLVGSLAFGAGLLVAGLAPAMPVFVSGRGLQGLGSGLVQVAVYVVIAQGVPDSRRPRVFSLLAAAWVVPGLVGPLVTGVVVDHAHWRWVFLGVLPLLVLAVLALTPALRRTHAPRREEPAGAPGLNPRLMLWAAVAAVSAAFLGAVTEHLSLRIAPLVVLAALALLVAAVRLLPRGTLRARRGLPSVVLTRGVIGCSFLAAEAFLPLLLQELYGYTATAAGSILAAGSVTWALGSWWQGRAPEDADRPRFVVGGGLLITLSTGLLLLSVVLGLPGWLLVVWWGTALLGVGAAYPTTSLLVLRLSPPEQVGANSSSLMVSEALLGALSLAVAGATFTALLLTSPAWAFVSVLTIAVLSGAGTVVLGPRCRPVPAAVSTTVAVPSQHD